MCQLLTLSNSGPKQSNLAPICVPFLYLLRTHHAKGQHFPPSLMALLREVRATKPEVDHGRSLRCCERINRDGMFGIDGVYHQSAHIFIHLMGNMISALRPPAPAGILLLQNLGNRRRQLSRTLAHLSEVLTVSRWGPGATPLSLIMQSRRIVVKTQDELAPAKSTFWLDINAFPRVSASTSES